MPDNQIEGILETFLRLLIPQPNALFDYVQNSVANISMQAWRKSTSLFPG